MFTAIKEQQNGLNRAQRFNQIRSNQVKPVTFIELVFLGIGLFLALPIWIVKIILNTLSFVIYFVSFGKIHLGRIK